MKSQAIVGLLLFAVIFAPNIDQAKADIWSELGPALIQQLTSLWQIGDFEFMGHPCRYSVRPKIRRWQLYYYGKMWCPGLSPIVGRAKTRSRSGVVGQTVTDYVRQAAARNLIDEEEARFWLEDY